MYKLPEYMRGVVTQAIVEVSGDVFEDVQSNCPVDTGDLKASLALQVSNVIDDNYVVAEISGLSYGLDQRNWP